MFCICVYCLTDANNLYGFAMSAKLPIGGYSFLDAEQVAAFDIHGIDPDGDTGFLIEVIIL